MRRSHDRIGVERGLIVEVLPLDPVLHLGRDIVLVEADNSVNEVAILDFLFDIGPGKFLRFTFEQSDHRLES